MIVTNTDITYNEATPLNGAFKYLQTFYNDEKITNNNVKVSASTSHGNIEVPITRKDTESIYWYSDYVNESWYEVDFLKNTFYLKSYVIRDYSYDFRAAWKVYGSNDGIKYELVDDVIDFKRPAPDAYYNIYFECKYPKAMRIFRFISIGKRFYGDLTFLMHRLEFYGRFVERKPKTCNVSSWIFCIVFLFC